MNAGWLHNRRQVGNNSGPQLPCCPYLFFFIPVANCQALYLPGQSHSCVGGPQHGCAGDLLGQLGLRCALGTPRLAAAVIRRGHRCVPGPGKPGQAANGARGADCSTAAVSQPRGLRAWHSWVTLHPALGGQPAVGWHGSQGRVSCKLLESSERHFKAPCMEQAAVWFLQPGAGSDAELLEVLMV